jgi:hypothetical protein
MDDLVQTTTPPGPSHEPAGQQTFHQLFRASARKQDLCILAVLAWIAASDGVIAPLEQELMVLVAEASRGTWRSPAGSCGTTRPTA